MLSKITRTLFFLGIYGWMFAAGGCSVMEEEGQFICERHRDCPVGWRCDIDGDGRCYSPEGKEELWIPGSSDGEVTTDSQLGDSATTTANTGSDSGMDSTVDTMTDTTVSGSDIATDTEIDTDTDTDTDRGTDSVFDSATVSGTDTYTDTVTATTDDTEDTGDTATDDTDGTDSVDTNTIDTNAVDSDTLDTDTVDTDTGDTDIDTASDTTQNSCTEPIALTVFDEIFHGKWSEYDVSFFPEQPNSCGESLANVWFRLTIPANTTVIVQETSGSDVIVQQVAECDATDCIASNSKQERLRVSNSSDMPGDFYILVSEATGNGINKFTVSFSI